MGLFRKQLQLGRTLGNRNLKKSEGHLGDYLQRTLNIKMKCVQCVHVIHNKFTFMTMKSALIPFTWELK